jgi:hypothetical protein
MLTTQQGLALEGWEITIVTTKEVKNPWLPQFARLTGDIFLMPNFIEGNSYPNFLTYLVQSRNPDVVFVSNSEMGYLLVPLLKYHCPWVTVVDYVHSETPKWKNGGYARYSYALVDTLDRSIYASDHLRDYVIGYGRIIMHLMRSMTKLQIIFIHFPRYSRENCHCSRWNRPLCVHTQPRSQTRD